MIRIGLGHDTHRLAEGGPLRLGGVDIPYDHHLVGHSDADVLMHAITDALLGAANLPDIGQLFPNSSAENKGRDSADFLRFANHKVNEEMWRIINIDTVIFAQEPKLSPYKEAMRTALAAVLDIHPEQIGIKSKTGEHVGPVGRQEAIQAECVVLLERIDELI
ncbi:2-C-methyl-D-erythritol 2,4-cyclodiphosphate synthase [Blastopirellula sp. JC732]|uniref:2-C-methyl-D-erythritol 2,4-cyclodiphosphate synthase n=1 Tax=Blastopirellula sediminis TaxID=2894196 RepID=A0A9X1MPS9_9BACT|nr:2-C-methyl-D-erythritol 2,4-cyclodiphosphate synthase [Blastopirellula sediminis]MCC9605597.1 2-C-methyl-D-erythritol 2,4-cyclodiphosphate synthase [Blastopirellula sediminis]MCC9631103.1 2-C-methyl-D-erythritol 2,4-cyclodiphosphate synthase [Blastopirellula sediminis]